MHIELLRNLFIIHIENFDFPPTITCENEILFKLYSRVKSPETAGKCYCLHKISRKLSVSIYAVLQHNYLCASATLSC